jgi:2-oxo-4-hydroxy-4-carboxy-5-ureidoimidazoline decarboxylase
MTDALARWNRLGADDAAHEILSCGGSTAWAGELAARRPFDDETMLLTASDEIWSGLGPPAWLEAFSKHPRIGEHKAPESASVQSATWSKQEQQNIAGADSAVQLLLAKKNQEYEKRFGRVFIVCAAGKSAAEILDILERRLGNDAAVELHEAANEQRKITNLRLRKWLGA